MPVVVLVTLASSSAHADSKPEPKPSRYGVMVDIGIPDGAVASLAYRAHRDINAHIGIGHNTNSLGLRTGARWTPIHHAISPFVALEAGHYPEAQPADWMLDSAPIRTLQLLVDPHEIFSDLGVGSEPLLA